MPDLYYAIDSATLQAAGRALRYAVSDLEEYINYGPIGDAAAVDLSKEVGKFKEALAVIASAPITNPPEKTS